MALPATDNFNRADGGLGANWTSTESAGGLTISSNLAICTRDEARSSSWTADSFSADQYGQFVIGESFRLNSYVWIELRSSGSGATKNCYRIRFRCDGSGVHRYYIAKIISGTETNLTLAIDGDTTGSTITYGNGDTLHAEAEGTTIRLKVNGEVVDYATNSEVSSGSVGLGGFFSSQAVSPTLDNFEAGDLGTGDTQVALSGVGGTSSRGTVTPSFSIEL